MKVNLKPLMVVAALMLIVGSAWAANISSISPALGPAAGGTVVTIRYTGGGAPLSVRFGTVLGTGFAYAAPNITVTAPASITGPGAVNVTIFDDAGGTTPAGGLGDRANGFTYTNDTLVINVKVNIAQIIAIRWANTITSTADDTLPTALDHTTAAQSISAFAWSINDGGRTTPLTDLDTVYVNNSATESRAIAIESLSKTNALHVKINSTAPNGGGVNVWSLGTAAAQAAGPDVVNFTAKLGGSNAIDLTIADQTITDTAIAGAGAAPLVKMTGAGVTTPQELILSYKTPSTATVGFNVDMLSTVTLTASLTP